MTPKFLLSDALRAFWAGLGVSVLALPIFYNLDLLELLPIAFHAQWLLMLIGWLIAIPVLSALGLYILHYLVAHRRPTLFQIGKYGIVGLLNTVLYASVFNVLILASSTAQGLMVDLFAAIAFVVAVTNSYFWNKFWIFETTSGIEHLKEYKKFFFVTAMVAVLNTAIVHGWVNILGAPAGIDETIWVNLVVGINIPISFFGNYFGYRFFVFKHR